MSVLYRLAADAVVIVHSGPHDPNCSCLRSLEWAKMSAEQVH